MTVDQAARELDVSPRRVRYWCQKGHLTAHRKGQRAWLIPDTALENFQPPKEGRPKLVEEDLKKQE
ncbi:MAG: helix-turn-helix domain-containing protein [Actinomycetota bacterium]|nr:helix-turn-helix domain-containing protein [Actinomycetota bacterium]